MYQNYKDYIVIFLGKTNKQEDLHKYLCLTNILVETDKNYVTVYDNETIKKIDKDKIVVLIYISSLPNSEIEPFKVEDYISQINYQNQYNKQLKNLENDNLENLLKKKKYVYLSILIFTFVALLIFPGLLFNMYISHTKEENRIVTLKNKYFEDIQNIEKMILLFEQEKTCLKYSIEKVKIIIEMQTLLVDQSGYNQNLKNKLKENVTDLKKDLDNINEEVLVTRDRNQLYCLYQIRNIYETLYKINYRFDYILQ